MSETSIIETIEGPAALMRSQRRTLAISVLPSGALELIAPEAASLAEIHARIGKRRRWIRSKRQAFREMNSLRHPLRYVNGATHRYLGRQYRLKIIRGEDPSVSLRGAFFIITAPDSNETMIQNLLSAWYRDRANDQFTKRVAQWDAWCRRHGLQRPQMSLRVMSNRWGSSLPSGVIHLNPELVKAPSACVDYVIAHEICHLKHADHGPEFRNLLQLVCPNHKTLKDRLERLP